MLLYTDKHSQEACFTKGHIPDINLNKAYNHVRDSLLVLLALKSMPVG